MQKSVKGLAAALLCAVLFLTGCNREAMVYSSGLTEETIQEEQGASQRHPETDEKSGAASERAAGKENSEQTGYVYVCGAVNRPGVYPIRADMRVFEAIELAGGFAEDADAQWLNQAETLQDGQKLYVYTREETSRMQTEALTVQEAAGQENGLININTADRRLLMTLPGIGESKADAVIQYRTESGAFGSIEEIQNVPGIKNAVFMKIKDLITV